VAIEQCEMDCDEVYATQHRHAMNGSHVEARLREDVLRTARRGGNIKRLTAGAMLAPALRGKHAVADHLSKS
jgi:hypothetical protein